MKCLRVNKLACRNWAEYENNFAVNMDFLASRGNVAFFQNV